MAGLTKPSTPTLENLTLCRAVFSDARVVALRAELDELERILSYPLENATLTVRLDGRTGATSTTLQSGMGKFKSVDYEITLRMLARALQVTLIHYADAKLKSRRALREQVSFKLEDDII